MTRARSLWNGSWVVRDHSPTLQPSFEPAPADIKALPPDARPLVVALLSAAAATASSAQVALADDAQLRVQIQLDGTARVKITGASTPPPGTRLPPGLGVTEADLLDLAHQGLWVVDPDGRSLYVNAAVALMLGSTVPQLASRSLLGVVDRADRQHLIALFTGGASAPDGRATAPNELAGIRLRRDDGSTVWAKVSVHRITDARDVTAAVVAIITDTTVEHDREIELIASIHALEAQLAERSHGSAPDGPVPAPTTADELTWLAVAPSPEVATVEVPTVDELPAGAEIEDVEPAAPEPAAPAATAVKATAVEVTAVEVTDTDAPDPQAAGDAAYRAAFTHAPVGMAIIELDGSIREANPAMMTLLDPLGRAPHPMKLTDLVTDDEQADLAQRLAALGAGATTTLRVEVPINPSTEGTVWTLLSVAVVTDVNGRPAYAIAQAEDITERRVAEHDLVHQTLHDPLTGLGNRLLLRDQLQQALSIANEVPFAVMFLDLDRFKSVNDTYGHDAGDNLLVGVSQRLRRIVRSADTVARLGGDEFAIIAQGIADREGAEALADKVRAGLRAPFRVGDVDISATASVGIVIGNREYATGDQLLRDADIAMYRAKDGGRDRAELFDDDIRLQEMERLETERTLHAALEDDGLKLHYQPIIDLHTGRAVGAEALLRIAGSDEALLTPESFMGVAEDSKLILDVGAWVLREVCHQLARWSEAGFGHLAAWVNVTGLELASPRFATLVQRALSAQRIDPTRLHLECTENVLLEASPSTIEHLRTLAAAGISVGIDDFGTGYSSLGYLRDLPVSFLKIDAAFTRRLSEPGGASMVEAMVGLGRSLGLRIVAEGVESLQEMESLARIGCDLAQGHLFARPGPIDTITLAQHPEIDISWP